MILTSENKQCYTMAKKIILHLVPENLHLRNSKARGILLHMFTALTYLKFSILFYNRACNAYLHKSH